MKNVFLVLFVTIISLASVSADEGPELFERFIEINEAEVNAADFLGGAVVSPEVIQQLDQIIEEETRIWLGGIFENMLDKYGYEFTAEYVTLMENEVIQEVKGFLFGEIADGMEEFQKKLITRVIAEME